MAADAAPSTGTRNTRQNAPAASGSSFVKPVAANNGTQQPQQGRERSTKNKNQYVPWDDDADMDLWRTTAPEKHQQQEMIPTPQQTSGKAAADGTDAMLQRVSNSGVDPYFYGRDEGDIVTPSYGARPYIRDWSAAAIAAAAAAPMQKQTRLPATERRERKSIRTSLAETVGDGVEVELQQSPLNTDAAGAPLEEGQSASNGGVGEATLQEEDTDDPLSTRQHWMPDRLCRNCHSCEAPFTFLRRRHHCRLCGQVFCAACSAHFIDVSDQATVDPSLPKPKLETATSAGSTTLPTASSAAAVDSAASVGDRLEDNMSPTSLDGYVLQRSPSGMASPTASSSLAGASEGAPGGQQSAPTAATTSRRTIRVCHMCYDQVSKADAGGSNILFGPQTTAPPTQAQDTAERGVGILQSHLRPRSPDKIHKDSGEEELARQVEAEYAAALVGSSQAKAGGKVVHPTMLTSDTISSASKMKAQIDARSQITNSNRQLGLAAANHLEKTGKELLLSDAPLLLKEIGYTQTVIDPEEEDKSAERAAAWVFSRWISTLMMHATRCVQTVQQNVKDGDLLDIVPYCKVKGERAG
jgi:hypothetical protein